MSSPAPVERAAPSSAPKRVVAGVLCLVGVAILIGLGVWQLQRLKWKEGLLAHVAALQSARMAKYMQLWTCLVWEP